LGNVSSSAEAAEASVFDLAAAQAKAELFGSAKARERLVFPYRFECSYSSSCCYLSPTLIRNPKASFQGKSKNRRKKSKELEAPTKLAGATAFVG
jgi:hypothetical protein